LTMAINLQRNRFYVESEQRRRKKARQMRRWGKCLLGINIQSKALTKPGYSSSWPIRRQQTRSSAWLMMLSIQTKENFCWIEVIFLPSSLRVGTSRPRAFEILKLQSCIFWEEGPILSNNICLYQDIGFTNQTQSSKV
jgi:hypothetical protein